MIRRDSLLWRNVAEHSFLMVILAAHSLVSLPFLHSDELSQIKVVGEWWFFNKLLIRGGEFARAHVAGDLRRNLIVGDFQVVASLQIHPERSSIVEVPCQPKRSVGGDAAPFVHNIRYSGHWYTELKSQFVHAQADRKHEFFAENFSGMNGFPVLGHIPS